MNLRLKMSEDVFNALRQQVFAKAPLEAGCFALAGITFLNDTTALTLRRAIPVPVEEFVVQEEYRLEVSTRATGGLISLCQANGLLPVVCHSHPGEIPYSSTDDYGERRLARTFADFVEGKVVLVSLLFCPESVDGRIWLRGDPRPQKIRRIDVIGPTYKRVLDRERNGAAFDLETVNRQILAFGERGQRAVASAKIGIVGLGGTGSAVAEQLARLGTADFVLIDHDHLTKSNVTRVYGSNPAHVPNGKPGPLKVEVARNNILAIQPLAKVVVVANGVHEDGVEDQLKDRDLIFMCTDEHRGRAKVNDLCYRHLIPAINMGVSIRSRDGAITAAGGGVDILLPDGPCLWCSEFLSSARIRSESMPDEERRKLLKEGDSYVQDLSEPAPMVVSATTTVAALAITEFLRMFTGFADVSLAPQRLRWNMLEGTVSRGRTTVTDKCICRKCLGRGDL